MSEHQADERREKCFSDLRSLDSDPFAAIANLHFPRHRRDSVDYTMHSLVHKLYGLRPYILKSKAQVKSK